MAEGIVAADGDRRESRGYGSDERSRRCVLRSVVSDLQHIGAKIDAAGQQLRFARLASVAGEERSKLAPIRTR
jgi:GH35 family endo-1,4-beta-xylanase